VSQEEQDYLESRAEIEMELARQASHEKAVEAHYLMASAYLDRIHGEAQDSPGP
jgi:hypothetical protein